MTKELSSGVVSGELIFIEHNMGDTIIDGRPTKWNNVAVSDGLATFKVRNLTGSDSFASFKRGDKVRCEFQLDRQPKVDKPTLSLLSISAVKVA